MHKHLLHWVFLFGLVAMVASRAFAQGTEPGRIVLARVTGAVTLTNKADNSTRAATNNEQIAAGYVVTTAAEASVVLVFSNGSTVNLRGDSQLDIETFMQDPFAEDFRLTEATAEPSTSTTRLNLSRGELIGNVKTLNSAGGSSFVIQTPVGAAGIRGTTFRIVFRPDGAGNAFFALTTVEGNVVLARGGVETPVAAVDNQAREVSINVEVTVDTATGAVTVTTPAGQTFTVQTAAATTTASVVEAIQQNIQAIATVVFTPPATTTTNPNPTNNETPPATETPPAAQPTPPRTTTGDGVR
ncbi:MAG TPA: FecR domain-containing protein [Opitutaceae bacterium]